MTSETMKETPKHHQDITFVKCLHFYLPLLLRIHPQFTAYDKIFLC